MVSIVERFLMLSIATTPAHCEPIVEKRCGMSFSPAGTTGGKPIPLGYAMIS